MFSRKATQVEWAGGIRSHAIHSLHGLLLLWFWLSSCELVEQA